MAPQAHTAHPASLGGIGDEFVRRAVGCFVFGMLMAAPVLALLYLLDRGAHSSPLRALLGAAVAGVGGTLALHVHCPITHREHLLAGHAGITLFVVAAYAAVVVLLFGRSRDVAARA
jgi:hypothetical protein